MNCFFLLFEIVCFFGVILAVPDKDENGNIVDETLCNITIRYEVEYEKEYKYTYMKPYPGWCFSLKNLRCTKYKMKERVEVQNITEYRNKTVLGCCEGYQNVSGRCIPTCQEGCVNGFCGTPNNCSCFRGWKGFKCTEECDEGSFGKGCMSSCLCKNGAMCDKKSGKCICLSGYTGEYCEAHCSGYSLGKECDNICKCENGGICNATNKSCHCLPGYYGKLCNHKCIIGSFGNDCRNICKCKMGNIEVCNHISGECVCKSGWRGNYCEKVCEDKTWGPSCKNQCDCGHNSSCHRVTGECSCVPGWHGSKCEKKCPVGYFERDCKMKCPECLHKPGTCHHETGWCNCPDGSTGPTCNLECPEGKYGENCENLCLCTNNSICDPINGECLCLPGWIGTECQFPCPEGTYGNYCNFACNCSDKISCNRYDGNCNCDETDDDPLCLKGSLVQSIEDNSASPVIMILAFIIFGVLVFLIMMVRIVLKRKKPSKAEILQDDSSSVTNRGDFSDSDGKKFSNPVYDEMNERIRNQPRSVAEVPPFRDSQNDANYFDVDFNIPDYNAKIMSDTSGKNNIGKELETDNNRISIDPYSVKYTNRGTEDIESAFPDNSIYADVDLKEEHHYEFPVVCHRRI